MGCDIHMAAERRTADGRWEMCGEPTHRWGYAEPWEPYDNRNYALFSVLANVRNGYGFAGCDTGEGYRPIDDPRGLPPDMSPLVKEWAEAGDHSHSWLLVRELLDYDWDQIAVKRGCVRAHQFAAWDGKTSPASYSGGIGGHRAREITNDEMRRLVERADAEGYSAATDTGYFPTLPPGLSPELRDALQGSFTCVQWSEPYGTSCRHFLETGLPKLLALGNPDDVRIVFWFDS